MLEPGTYLVALDERGKEFASPDLAKSLTKWMDDPGIKRLIFLIGDPYGISKPVIEKANLLWAVSKGTLPSDLAWVVATEQIYRAFTLIKGIPYHHE